MAAEVDFLKIQLQQLFPLLKLPSPIRSTVYKFVVLASDGCQEYEVGGRSSIQIARFIVSPKTSRQEFQYLQQQLSPVLLDTGKAYPSTYSSESVETIKNLARVLPKADSTEFQRIFWQYSTLSIFMLNSWYQPLFSGTTTTPQGIFHNGFNPWLISHNNLGRIARNIWSDSNMSSIRNLAIDLSELSSGKFYQLCLKRILRLHLELDSLSLTISYIVPAEPSSPSMKGSFNVSDTWMENAYLLKSLAVHKTLIVVLHLTGIDWPNEYDSYKHKHDQLTALLRNIFLPYSLREGFNQPFAEHESFGLEGLFREERDEFDEKLDYLIDRTVVIREMDKHLMRISNCRR